MITGKTFDNGVLCSSPNSVVVDSAVAGDVKREFIRQGARFLNADESAKLAAALVSPQRLPNPKFVGKSATFIAKETGIDVTPDTRVLTGEPLVVTFRLPRSSRLLDGWFDAEATVARVVHGRRNGEAGSRLGIEFEGLAPSVGYFLHTLLEHVPPPVPGRARRVDYAASVRRAALS